MTTREMAAHLMAECLTDAMRMVRAEVPTADPAVVLDGACRLATMLFHARWQAGAAALLRDLSTS